MSTGFQAHTPPTTGETPYTICVLITRNKNISNRQKRNGTRLFGKHIFHKHISKYLDVLTPSPPEKPNF